MAGGYQGDLMAAATVTPEDPRDPYYYVDYTQPIEVVEVNLEEQAADITFNIAVIFVLSMIVGLLVFESLSRRWHS